MNNSRQCQADQYLYAIQPGDTLNYIALRLEKSVSRIMAANPGLDPFNLRVGQIICVPACPPNHRPIIIQPGDTLYRISQTNGITIASILEANPIVDPSYLSVALWNWNPASLA